MAELTVDILVDTYIKLTRKVKVYATPEHGDAGKPVWFEKEDIAGKLFSWITKNPASGKAYNHVYLMFKVNDDFSASGKSYFIRLEKGLIQWSFTKLELIKKRQANMNLFEKFVDDTERTIRTTVTDYVENLKDSVKSGLWTGGAIVAGVLLFKFVIVPEIQFRRIKRVIKTAASEIKR